MKACAIEVAVAVGTPFGQDNQPWQTIDGVVVSAAKSGTQGGIYWDYGNVEEAKVGTFGSPAEVPTRGVLINGIVKSGSNDFHGSGFYAFQNHVLQSNNALRSKGGRPSAPTRRYVPESTNQSRPGTSSCGESGRSYPAISTSACASLSP